MALVAYGSSDESADDTEEDTPTAMTYKLSHNPSPSVNQQYNGQMPMPTFLDGLGNIPRSSTDICVEKNDTFSSKPDSLLFKSLSEPKYNLSSNIDEIEQESDLVLEPNIFALLPESHSRLSAITARKGVKRLSQPVKITLPSLSEFNDEEDEEPIKKKPKPSKKGSGLFAILPAPKNIKQREAQQPFVPYILTKKVSTTPLTQKPSTPMKLATASKNLTTGSQILPGYDSEEDEDQDFFSLNIESKLPNPINMFNPPLMTDIPDDSKTIGPDINPSYQNPIESVFHPSPWVSGPSELGRQKESNWQDSIEGGEGPSCSQMTSDTSTPQEDLQLDADAMQRLCGRRSKKQHPVEFIEVNGKEIMPDPNDWLVKQLSEEQPKMRSHSHKRNDGPTTQQRRKHQITYLAFQAKENELDLKNQWSQNRMSRKQTQSKYGF